jgi:hypothetical protein
VAKRSVKRARRREREQGKPRRRSEPAATPGYRTRGFRLGALTAVALLVPLAVLALVITGGDDPPHGAAVTQDPIQAQAAKLRRESRERDKRQVQELTERMTTMLGELAPVVRGLAKTVPPDQRRVGPLATSVAVEKWSRAAREAAAYFENPPSGETDTNIARMGFAVSVDQLVEAVDTYRLALTDARDRRALLERVRTERDLAVKTWFLGGTELDAVNHKYGYGHHHVFLAPEGSGIPDLQTG